MRRAPVLALAALAGAIAIAACDGGDDGSDAGSAEPEDMAPALRLNHVQVLGSHNSYHLAPEQAVLDGIAAFSAPLAAELDYGHRPLLEQLDEFGIRQLEIDVYADPDGGRFADRPALSLLGLPTASGEPMLAEPGAKVLHLVDVDFRSTCVTFVACLEQLDAWSASEPDHLPLVVLVEAKHDTLADTAAAAGVDVSGLPFVPTEVEPWTRERFDELEDEILSVFDRDRLITPDDVRGDHATLEEAVLTGEAWPTLDAARGRMLFALVDLGQTRDDYVGDATSLEDRLLFTSSEPGRADAAFLRLDDAVADGDRIRAAVEAGYLVRTRADVPAIHAVAGDTGLRDAALASGAHFVSTDYYAEDPELATGYVVTMPGAAPAGAARCNPVSSPPGCQLPTG